MRRFASGHLMALLTLSLLGQAFAGNKETKSGNGTLDVPLPIGQKAKTLVFPFYNPEGRLQMNFQIAVATRLDDEQMRMAEAIIDTYDEKGAPEMKILLPKSTLNLRTKVVTSDGDVTIQRSDFHLTGEGLDFNTQTRQGTLTGNVKMLIYDREEKAN